MFDEIVLVDDGDKTYYNDIYNSTIERIKYNKDDIFIKLFFICFIITFIMIIWVSFVWLSTIHEMKCDKMDNITLTSSITFDKIEYFTPLHFYCFIEEEYSIYVIRNSTGYNQISNDYSNWYISENDQFIITNEEHFKYIQSIILKKNCLWSYIKWECFINIPEIKGIKKFINNNTRIKNIGYIYQNNTSYIISLIKFIILIFHIIICVFGFRNLIYYITINSYINLRKNK